HFRNLLISKEPKTVQLLEVSENIKKKYLEQSSALSTGLLLSALNIANHCEVNYRTSNNKRLQVELALMKMCHIASALLLSDKTIESPASEVKKKRLKKAEKESVETKPKAAETEKVEEKAVSFSTAKKKEENKAAAIAQQKPAVKQTLQEDAQKQPSVAAAATVQEKTTAKPGWGAVKSRLNVPDLNAIFEEKKEEETDEVKLVEGDLQQKIDPAVFKEKWRGFAERLRAENKITLYTIMTSGEPVLEGNVIKIGVENRIQEQELREGKIDILNYLRIELKNYSLDLKETMLEQERVRKPYTSKEKYQAMVTKNPKLDLLRRKFDLGLS